MIKPGRDLGADLLAEIAAIIRGEKKRPLTHIAREYGLNINHLRKCVSEGREFEAARLKGRSRTILKLEAVLHVMRLERLLVEFHESEKRQSEVIDVEPCRAPALLEYKPDRPKMSRPSAFPDYMAAAGREKPKRGRPALGPAPERADLEALYLREGRTIRETAEVLGCSKESVTRALRAFGIKARPKTAGPRLSAWTPGELRDRVKRDGLRPTARALGVAPATLLKYCRRQSGEK